MVHCPPPLRLGPSTVVTGSWLQLHSISHSSLRLLDPIAYDEDVQT